MAAFKATGESCATSRSRRRSSRWLAGGGRESIGEVRYRPQRRGGDGDACVASGTAAPIAMEVETGLRVSNAFVRNERVGGRSALWRSTRRREGGVSNLTRRREECRAMAGADAARWVDNSRRRERRRSRRRRSARTSIRRRARRLAASARAPPSAQHHRHAAMVLQRADVIGQLGERGAPRCHAHEARGPQI